MTSGNGLLEVGLPIATEFSTQSEDVAADFTPAWMPWQPVEQHTDEELSDESIQLGPQNGRKRYDDDDGDAEEDEVEFDVDDEEDDDALTADDADDDFDDDDDDDDFDDDDDDDADDFDDD